MGLQRLTQECEQTLGAGDSDTHVFEEEQLNSGILEGSRVEFGALDKGPRSNDVFQPREPGAG